MINQHGTLPRIDCPISDVSSKSAVRLPSELVLDVTSLF